MKTIMAIEKREDPPPLEIFIRNEKGELLKFFYWWRTEAEFWKLVQKTETISITSPHHSANAIVVWEKKK